MEKISILLAEQIRKSDVTADHNKIQKLNYTTRDYIFSNVETAQRFATLHQYTTLFTSLPSYA